ncbi:protrudin isoform X2 [Nematostella vectensis]|uniref:protrudin isoform X2 n=1 Tax=Nematostella vectensis TaxID=45351 RepID=UPI002077144E|nr:protrudin isoform X2 [Nematostella vectensis]
MCEKDTRRTDEKADETSDNDSREKTRTVKFDIGEFVHTHRKLKLLCSSWVDLYRRIVLVFSWQSPKTSFVWFIICSYLAFISPVCFLAFPLAYISILLVSSGIQRAGTHNSTLLDKSKLIKKKAEDKLNSRLALEKQVKEDLKDCIYLLSQIESLSNDVCLILQEIHNVFIWKDTRKSIICLVILLLLIVFLLLMAWRWVMLITVLSLFCLNSGFDQVFRGHVLLAHGKVKRFCNHILMTTRSRQSLRRLSFQGSSDFTEQWFDAKESDTTGDEDDDISEQEDTNESLQIQKTTEYKSVVSRLVDYRQKQKKFNSGNCSSCNVPFKSILKKRQYCRHCGEGFCSRCCSHRVKRAVFGATAPAAYAETVLVCKPCYDYLMGPYSEDKPEEVDSG